MATAESPQNTRNDPTLADLIADLWQAKFYLMVGALAGLFIALGFMATAVPHYRATMLVAPAERSTGPDIKALLPDNSSFAVQYMLSAMGSPESGDYMRFEHILREPSVAAALLQDERVMAGIAGVRRFNFQSPETPDSAVALAAYLQDHVKIEPVGTTPLRRVVYGHPDRAFAAYLLARLHDITDSLIRQEVRARTHSREAYLQNALATTEHPDHRRALTSLLMEQEHIQMILAMDEPFAAIIAEPPAAGVKPDWPKAPLVVPAFMLGCMLLAFVVYGLRRSQRA